MTETLTREQWLLERRDYLGATDAASILGKGFSTPLGVYNDKLGLPNPEPDTDSLLRMEIGLALEPALASFFTRETSIPIREIGTLRHPEFPFIGASPDRITESGECVVELKTYGIGRHSEFGEEGTDEIPDGYHIQLTMQMGVARACGHPVHTGFLYALNLGSTTRKTFVVPFDQEFFDFLLGRLTAFWTDHVEAKVPPAPTAKDEDRLRLLFPTDNGEMVLAEPEDDDLVSAILQSSSRRKAACEEFDNLKARLIERIGPYAGMTSLHGVVKFAATKPSQSTNWEAVAKALSPVISPVLLMEHTTEKPGARRLLLPKEAK